MATNKKTVIIGLDGVPFDMIKGFAQAGIMPHTTELMSGAIFKKMKSSLPEVSSVAWSSIITGENPGKHGIFGFTELVPHSYRIRFPNFSDLKMPPFWELTKETSVIINVPSTYPVRPMNGVHISGFISIEYEKSVYPPSLIPTLNSFGYRLDVDSRIAHKSMDLFIKDMDETHDARIRAYRYLWDNSDWRIFMLVFTGTDRLMHFLWDAYEDTNHKYHDFFLNYFRRIDSTIGEIASRLQDDDLLMMLSDHGFERLDKDIYLNRVLMEEGFLQFKHGQEISQENICYGTKAFVLDPARIYLNRKGKYPAGTVDETQAQDVLSQLERLFGSLQIDGKKVIRDIYRKQQIYSGPYLDDAPDLVLVGEKGFNLKANVKASQVADKGIFTGKHTYDDAFLLVKGVSDPGIIPDEPAVSQVKGIIERAIN
ncbi:MAG: alkaline phosphatase family protein [Phycisphaerae bacterium]|nr:alkaline phosphatase family protein [Phycisphaerae bacterium]